MKKNSRGKWVRPGQAPMYTPASEEEQEHPEKCLSSAIVHKAVCSAMCSHKLFADAVPHAGDETGGKWM